MFTPPFLGEGAERASAGPWERQAEERGWGGSLAGIAPPGRVCAFTHNFHPTFIMIFPKSGHWEPCGLALVSGDVSPSVSEASCSAQDAASSSQPGSGTSVPLSAPAALAGLGSGLGGKLHALPQLRFPGSEPQNGLLPRDGECSCCFVFRHKPPGSSPPLLCARG